MEDFLKKILKAPPAHIHLGLDRLKTVLGHLENPHKKLPPVIHIAGTNGKGSTLSFLTALLESSGAKVHRNISPHLISVQERFYSNGHFVEEQDIQAAVERILSTEGGDTLTYFEVLTLAAFLLFSEHPADYVLLETGLGGRLDATNVIDHPKLTLFTPIDYDHQDFLGNTLTEIATEKAGIMKKGVRSFSSPQHPEAARILNDFAKKMGNHLEFCEEPVPYDLSLKGDHQRMNAALAIKAFEFLKGETYTDDFYQTALGNAVWPGRFQEIQSTPLSQHSFILDGAHNEASLQALSNTLRSASRPLYGLVALKSAKDRQALKSLVSVLDKVIFIPLESEASHSPEALHKIYPNSMTAPDFKTALKLCEPYEKGTVLIAGSLHLVGTALEYLNTAE